MKGLRIFLPLFSTAPFCACLLTLVFYFSVPCQICRDCEIPRSQRTQRLNAANQALQTADSQRKALSPMHCPFGLPVSPANVANEKLLYKFEWSGLNDDDLKVSLWLGYELTKAQAQARVVPRVDCFRRDNRLENNDASFCQDFEEPFFARGHLFPACDLRRSQTSMDNSFLFYNMAPQYPNFNQKTWEKLESRARGWAISGDGTYLVTGAVFAENGDSKPDGDEETARVAPRRLVAMSTHFYKIALKLRPNGIIDSIAVLSPHDNRADTNNLLCLNSKIVSVDQMEELTG